MQHARNVRLLLPKRTFRLTITTASQATGFLYTWSGTATVQAIGSSLLFDDSDTEFFAGLLDFVLTFISPLETPGSDRVTLTSIEDMADSAPP